MKREDREMLEAAGYAVALAAVVFAIVLLLSGCSAQPVVTKPEQVLVEGRPQPCTPPRIDKPTWATSAATAAPFDEKVKAEGVELEQRIAYEIKLEAALAGCTTPSSPPQPTPASEPPAAAPAPKSFGDRVKSLFHLN